ncbi:MAG TPA: WD40 repeat domain-containing protein [Actinophytocola sp.]|jgi:WD40 repeat protein|nr:WD40 repeat domain-containing protein [Actinophytocola sp.]
MSTPGQLISTTELPFVGGVIAWSPAGDWLAVGAYLGTPLVGYDSSPAGGLAIVDADAGGMRWHVDEWRVGGLAVSQDGRLLALASDWGEFIGPHSHHVRVLDTATGRELWARPDATTLGPAAFSPDGRYLAVDLAAEDDTTGVIADAATGAVRHDLGQGHRAVAFSSDSRWVAVRDTDDNLMLLDPNTGTNRWQEPVPSDTHVTFTENDGRIVAAERNALLVNAENGAVVSRSVLEGGWKTRVILVGEVAGTAFSPDRRALVRSGSLDGQDRVGVFGVADGRLRWERAAVNLVGGALGPANHIYPDVAFGPDSSQVAANHAITDQWVPGVMVLNAATGATIWQDTADAVLEIAYSPDGSRIAASGRTADGRGFVRVYRTGTELARCVLAQPAGRVAATTAGIRLVAVTSADRKATICDADSGQRLLEREHPGNLTAIAFTPDGQRFVTGATDQVRMFDTVSGAVAWRNADGGAVNAIAVSPDGRWVAAARADRTAQVIGADGAPRWSRSHPNTVSHIAFSAGGEWVATGCGDRATRVLDAATGDELHRYQHDGPVQGLTFGATGTLLAVGAKDATAVVLDAATGETRLLANHPQSVAAVALSPDGTLLATGNGATLRVYAVPDGSDQPVLEDVLPARIVALTFHPTDRRLAVVTDEPVVRIVDSDDATERFRLIHPSPVRDIAFSPRGDLIATACADNIARIFACASDG